MNLTSCNNCGVVLDKDKLNFPEDIYIYDEEYKGYNIDHSLCFWNGDDYVPCVKCPVCGNKIGEDE